MAKTCEVSFEVKVPADVVKKEFEESAKRVRRTVTLKGFRKGKVPLEIVKTRFKGQVVEEMLRTLLPKIAQEEVEKRKIMAIDLPMIEDVQLDDDFNLTAKVKVYVWPKIKLANYKKLKIKRKPVKVTDEDVEKVLEQYRRILLPPGKQNDPNLKPEDLPELTDSAVQQFGFKSLAEMRERIRKNLEIDRSAEARREMEKQIREFLLKHSRLDVPELWVRRQFEQKLHSFASTLAQMRMREDQIKAILEQRKDDILKSAEDDVKLFFIIEEIGRKEGIEASDEEIETHVEKMAERYGISPEEMKRYIEIRNGWDSFCLDMDHEKVWNYLISIGTK